MGDAIFQKNILVAAIPVAALRIVVALIKAANQPTRVSVGAHFSGLKRASSFVRFVGHATQASTANLFVSPQAKYLETIGELVSQLDESDWHEF
ncbi:hypothetical protein B5K06_32715 [Rhizobium grahamii]|uniref:Uncharacterized protein n=1 Tax=Rhizobium grahamii TaxID=1120045 RepID=A0A370KE75_9HYPH|nr:hypothetical protein [Rhizobium grahamii]RDJ01945.1 hypothetical protein B5K06_32715 [Rhizobium grahamii]